MTAMVNRHRGEISAKLDGRQWTLCLTLGALAELESRLQANDLSELAGQFSSGKLSADQLLAIICAGLRGGGHDLSDEEVAEMRVEGGIAGYANIAAELLTATFSPQSPDGQQNISNQESPSPNPA